MRIGLLPQKSCMAIIIPFFILFVRLMIFHPGVSTTSGPMARGNSFQAIKLVLFSARGGWKHTSGLGTQSVGFRSRLWTALPKGTNGLP